MMTPAPERRLIWDIFVRLFHWTLVFAIGFAWWTAEQGGNWMDWHMFMGYLVLALMGFRLLWGIWGSRYARFSQFVPSPAKTLSYFKAMLQRKEPHFTGHNPLGAWMVLALIAICTFQAGSGLFATDDIFTEGPFTQYISGGLASDITGWHKLNFNILLGLVGFHLLGVIYHQLLRKEKLVPAMLHGYKTTTAEGINNRRAYIRGVVTLIFPIAIFLTLYYW